MSRSDAGEIEARVETPRRKAPATIVVRLRHPQAKQIQSVTVNGRSYRDFVARKEWVRIANPTAERYTLVARY